MDTSHPDPEPQSAGRDARITSAGTAALVALAVLAFGTAATVMGPVLQPLLVAVFLFHATQFGAKSFARLGMQPWTAYAALIGLTLIASILTAQFVFREADIFRKSWPRYEDRIARYVSTRWPAFTAGSQPAPVTTQPARLPTAATVPAPAEPLTQPLTEQTRDLLAAADATVERAASADADQVDQNTDRNTDDRADDQSEDAADLRHDAPPRARAPVIRPARTTPADWFRITSQDVLDYVFSHGLHILELFVGVFCYLVFLFLGSRKLKARVLRAFPGERGSRLVAIGEGITESMERFMVVKTATGVGMAVSAGMLMYVFGLDHWMLWAFLFFAANYITYIGSMAACIPPLFMAYLDLDSAVMATLLSTLIVLNRVFWIDFFELRLSGKQLNLDPTLLFLWLSYWGWAWGILGLILAYPMLAAVRITLAHIGGLRGWALLLSDE